MVIHVIKSRNFQTEFLFNPLQPGIAYAKGFLMFSEVIDKQHRAVMG